MAKVISTILSLKDNMSGGLLRIARNTQGVTREMRAATRDVVRFKDKVSHAVTSAVKTTAKVGLAAGAGFAAYAVKSGAEFEAQMSKVQAISGASVEDTIRMTNAAREMGRITKFSATEGGQALEYMAMAGWKTDQMLAGLPGIMNLAAASGEELGLVSDIVTDALTAFKMNAEDTGRFVNVLAAASSNSNTNVAMMGETFKYLAPIAGTLGYSIEDTSVAIGLMANSSVKADQAGTSLRGVLTNLAKPSESNLKYMKRLGVSLTDNSGKVKPLITLLDEFRQKFAKLSQAKQVEFAAGIAGKTGMAGFQAMMNASEQDFSKVKNAAMAADSNNVAQQMADIMNDNLLGQLTKLKSGISDVGHTFYDAIGTKAKESVQNIIAWLDKLQKNGSIERWAKQAGDGFSWLVDHAGATFNWIQAHSEQIISVAKKIGFAFAGIKGLQFVGNIAKSINDLTLFAQTIGTIAGSSLPKLFGGIKKMGGGIASIGKPLLGLAAAHPIIAGIAAVAIAAGVLIYKNWDKLKPLFISIGDKLRAMWDSLKAFGSAFGAVFNGLWQSLLAGGEWLTQMISKGLNAIGRFGASVGAFCAGVGERVGAVRTWIVDHANGALEGIKTAFGNIKDSIVGAFDAARDKISGFFSWLDVKISNIPVIGNLYGGAKDVIKWVGGKIGANAMGTHYWGGGLTRVHERGGEIINLPSGTQIIPHDVSKQAVGGQPINIHITVQGNLIGNAQAADMIGEVIAGKIKRALANT